MGLPYLGNQRTDMLHLGGSSVYVRIRLKLSYRSKLQNNFPTFQEIKIDAKKIT